MKKKSKVCLKCGKVVTAEELSVHFRNGCPKEVKEVKEVTPIKEQKPKG